MANCFVNGIIKVWTTAVMLYTAGHRKGCKYSILHFFICLTISLSLNSFFFLCLRLVKIDLLVCLAIAGTISLLTTATLFFSKHVRCFVMLFVISCSMKQGRNMLLTAGSGLVAFWSIQNMLSNLYKVAESLMCTLKKKREFLERSPIQNYVQMIKWFKGLLNDWLPWLNLVKVEPEVEVTHTVDGEELKKKLAEAEAALREKFAEIEAIFGFVLSIGRKLMPVLGVILVLISTTYFLKKYTCDKKYYNIFITSRFVRYDERQKAKRKPHILPLTTEEEKQYIYIPCAKPRIVEWIYMVRFLIPVATNMVFWLIYMALDGLLYWITVVISSHLLKLKPIEVPLKLNIDKLTTVFSLATHEGRSANDFSYSIVLFEKECLPEPTLLLSNIVTPISVIIAVLVILSLFYAKLKQIQLLASEQFFTDKADKRVKHLHAKILRKRLRKENEEQDKKSFESLKRNVRFWFPIVDFCHKRPEERNEPFEFPLSNISRQTVQ